MKPDWFLDSEKSVMKQRFILFNRAGVYYSEDIPSLLRFHWQGRDFDQWHQVFHQLDQAARFFLFSRIIIRHIDGCRFTISATKGPVGDWVGDFIVREDFFDLAHGVYRYSGKTDWGHLELLFDASSDSIFVYGINRSKPGLIEPYSYTLVRH
jgi:hypothetical protein